MLLLIVGPSNPKGFVERVHGFHGGHKIRVLGSISPTFYARLFRTKLLREAFLYLKVSFVLFLRKNISAKVVRKVLVKLTRVRHIFHLIKIKGPIYLLIYFKGTNIVSKGFTQSKRLRTTVVDYKITPHNFFCF